MIIKLKMQDLANTKGTTLKNAYVTKRGIFINRYLDKANEATAQLNSYA